MEITLNSVWFILIAVLWIGYFVLEGFDFGVGMLLKVIGKNQAERRALLTTLGPVWDGNEVWLLVAGGATFAAFPEWYATLFSGFYLPLFFILISLIVRGVAFEYRSKYGDTKWRNRWDNAIIVASFIPSLLWGVAFANIVKGVPLEKSEAGIIEYVGGFFNLLNPYALLGGAVTLFLFATHGALFIALKTDGDIRVRANKLAARLGLGSALFAVMFLAWTNIAISDKSNVIVLSVVIVITWLSCLEANRRGSEGWAFLASSLTLGMVVVTLFNALYPYVMPSSLNISDSLDIYNAASTNYTLKVMTYVAVVITPLVLIYQGWTYWVFRKRLSSAAIPTPESGVLDKINS